MPAALSRHTFDADEETLRLMEHYGQPEAARLFRKLIDQLMKTDALAATALQHARDAESENADLRTEVAALRAEVEALEERAESHTLFRDDEPADYEVEEPAPASPDRPRPPIRVVGYITRPQVHTLNVKG